jgi:hypothetical protein
MTKENFTEGGPSQTSGARSSSTMTRRDATASLVIAVRACHSRSAWSHCWRVRTVPQSSARPAPSDFDTSWRPVVPAKRYFRNDGQIRSPIAASVLLADSLGRQMVDSLDRCPFRRVRPRDCSLGQPAALAQRSRRRKISLGLDAKPAVIVTPTMVSMNSPRIAGRSPRGRHSQSSPPAAAISTIQTKNIPTSSASHWLLVPAQRSHDSPEKKRNEGDDN